MSGESNENFEEDEIFPRHFITRPKLLADFLSPTETFSQNFILQLKIKSKILHPELQKKSVL